MFVTFLFVSSVCAASWDGQEYETKNPPSNELIDTIKEKIIEKGISENYFDSHFSLKNANVDSLSASTGWESASINWNFKINEEYIIDYRTTAYKMDEKFIATDDYLVDEGIAYSFDTRK